MVSLKVSALKAAVSCVSKDKSDNRHVLKSVLVEFQHRGDIRNVRFVATTGIVMFVCQHGFIYDADEQRADWSILIPGDVITKAIKGKKGDMVQLSALDDGRYMLGDIAFAATAGTFPDYARFIPSYNDAQSDKLKQFDPDLLVIGQTALRAFYDEPKAYYRLRCFANCDIGVMDNGASDAVFIVMPLRDRAFAGANSDNYQGIANF